MGKKINVSVFNEYKKEFYFSNIECKNNKHTLNSDLTSEMIIKLITNKDKIVKLNRSLSKKIKATNEIKNQPYNLYLFRTSNLNKTFFTDLITTKNKKQGNAGNIAQSYLNVCVDDDYKKEFYDFLKVKDSKLKLKNVEKDIKLLSSFMFKTIENIEPVIIFTKKDEIIEEVIKNETINDIIKDMVDKGYEPIKLVFKNLKKYLANMFYRKPINSGSLIEKFYDKLITNYIKLNHDYDEYTYKKLKNKELKEKGLIDFSLIRKHNSNNSYHCFFKEDKLIKIIIPIRRYLMFGNDYNTVSNFDEYSFVPKKYSDSFVKDYDKYTNGIEIDKLDIFDDIYKRVYDIDIEDEKPFINFLRTHQHTFVRELEKTLPKDSFFDRDSDKVFLYNIMKLDNKLFSTYNFNTINNLNNKTIRFNNTGLNDIKVFIYDRKGKETNNLNNNVDFFNLYKENNTLEREKLLTCFYINKITNELKRKKHKNIQLYLEKRFNKKEGGIGFVDLIIKSVLNGVVYAKAYEMKALYNYSKKDAKNTEYQAYNYNIKKFMSENLEASKTYDNSCIDEVEPLNLIDYKLF